MENKPEKVVGKAPQGKNTPKRKPVKKFWGYFLYGSFCCICVALGAATHYVGKSEVIRTIGKQAIFNAKPENYFTNGPTLTVLLLGCDEERAPGGKKITLEKARSDMMLVAKFDFKHNRITGVSIPRDLMVQLPGYKSHKINAYYRYGGKELAKNAAESVLNYPIDRVIAVNYKILQEVVDMVGGVDMFVPKKMRWTDRAGDLYINLKPGKQKLNGYNAMCFVRYRYGDSDWHRQQRQKEFLLAFKDTVVKKPSLLPALAEKARDIVEDQFTVDQMAALALFAMRIGNDNIKMGVIPTVVAGHYYLRLDHNRLPQILKEFHFVKDEPEHG